MDNENSSLLNKLTWLWVVFFTMDAVCNALIISLANVEWGSLSPTKRVLIGAMIGKTWTSSMIALFTQSAGRMEKGKPIIPIPSGDTEHFSKTDLTQAAPSVEGPKI